MRDLTRQLETQLQRFNKEEGVSEPRSGRAAVAIMIREGLDATEMFMIRRATREGGRDTWVFLADDATLETPLIFPVRCGKQRKRLV